jgi:hypothetical protein
MGALALACAGGVLVTGAGGCGTAADSTHQVPDAGGRTFARLTVVMTAPRDGGVTVAAAGRLLRYRGVDLDGAQVLAGASDRERAPLGRCTIRDDEAQLEDALATAPPDAAVQMLDAGDLLVRVAGQTVKMSPRFVPDIVPFVSGVVYDGETSASDTFVDLDLSSRDAAVVAFGGQQIGGFVTAAEVPAMPRFLSVSGRAAEGSLALDTAADLPLTWAAGDAHGTITLTVARDTGPTLRCRVQDVGHFTIPASALAGVSDSARGENVGLTIERSRRSSFSVQGIDSGEIEVTARDAVTLRSE